ncbi:MAG TPA: bifunctional phosphopantothenoylcysteine decarboxylase/phosphopantothenate--cysteine ligase CoaBC, partial [Candidatus Polarisedimenticolia bacterium]|nr:bifunctional phosphopantothenoylcysteine decarboxylase/phosphopantothenate--cysteine ligase CoaBC [Candidatus Polarisedimenticolia bacterium]
PATQANLSLLRSRGVQVMEPGEGELACGEVGSGRLPGIEDLTREILRLAARRETWAGETVLVTAGPTREYLDPARVLTNPSSGRMGYAVAEEALQRGARVLLVSGPSPLPAPWGAEVIRVGTTEEMRAAVLHALPRATMVIKAAAPADFRPTLVSTEKSPKEHLSRLELEPTPDILREVMQKKNGQLVVGFSAGTGDYLEAARRKLRDKQLDLVVANRVDRPGAGFESETNEGVMITAGGDEEVLPRLSKREMAVRLLDRVESLRKGRS